MHVIEMFSVLEVRTPGVLVAAAALVVLVVPVAWAVCVVTASLALLDRLPRTTVLFVTLLPEKKQKHKVNRFTIWFEFVIYDEILCILI